MRRVSSLSIWGADYVGRLGIDIRVLAFGVAWRTAVAKLFSSRRRSSDPQAQEQQIMASASVLPDIVIKHLSPMDPGKISTSHTN